MDHAIARGPILYTNRHNALNLNIFPGLAMPLKYWSMDPLLATPCTIINISVVIPRQMLTRAISNKG